MDIKLDEERRRQLLSDVVKLAGNTRMPDYKQRINESLEIVWQESEFHTVPITAFRSMLYDHPSLHDGHSRQSKKGKTVHARKVFTTPETKKIVYADLVRHLIEKIHRLPDDETMKTLASGLGFTEVVWNTTKKHLEMSGYKLIPTACGYDVAIDNPDKLRIVELEKRIRDMQLQMIALKKKANGKSS